MPNILSVTLYLADEAATWQLGARLAATLRAGLVVYLSGEVGAGKTTLARGCLRALGYLGSVKSPTFALVEVYKLSRLYLHHFDFYRFEDRHEWIDAGFRDAFEGTNVCLIEWPEKAGDQLPSPDLTIRLQHSSTGRQATLTGQTDAGKQCLEQLNL